MPFIFTRIVPAIAIGIFFFLGFIIFSNKPPNEPDVISLKTWQDADAPFGIPIEITDSDGAKIQTIQTFDYTNPQFHFYNPWERATIPEAKNFSAAMGTETWGYTYNAQPFNEPNKARGGNHSGDDINGIGGQNSDLADPVYAAADGTVVYIGNPASGWGNTIILAHKTTEGKVVQTMYTHLLTTHAHYRQVVARGKKIGSVGQAGGNYLAHLHLELRESDGVSPFLSGYPKISQHDRLSAEEFITKHQAPESLQLAPSFLNILHRNRILPELGMEIKPPYDAKSLQRYQRYIIEANKHSTQDSVESELNK